MYHVDIDPVVDIEDNLTMIFLYLIRTGTLKWDTTAATYRFAYVCFLPHFNPLRPQLV